MILTLAGFAAVPGAPAHAQPAAMRLRITLQPDCFRPSLAAACDRRKTGERGTGRLDFGPQIAIWIESADGARFVDTVLVTNLTALVGIGNRPGHAALPSGPKFPYGRRPMVLPVWAHRRGKLYDSLVMQDGVDREYWLGFHEAASSPDPYFCRPVTWEEIDVDAVSCPTQRFNSVKGRFFDPAYEHAPAHMRNGQPAEYVPPAKSYYPPRGDLTTFSQTDCDHSPPSGPCPISARKFAEINDLDLVAAATPAYGRPFSKLWRVPDELPEGDYAVLVEVSKEFDNNAHHAYPARQDQMLAEWGQLNNFGQPSVVFRVPFRLTRGTSVTAAATDIAGYGDPQGKSGRLNPPDGTINDAPGSGSGRLLVLEMPPTTGAAPLRGRVLIATETGGSVPPPDAGPDPADGSVPDAGAPVDAPMEAPPCPLDGQPLALTVEEVAAESAVVSFREPEGALHAEIEEYQIHRWGGLARTPEAFMGGLRLEAVPRGSPGNQVRLTVPNLKSESQYTIGARAVGACGAGAIGYGDFITKVRQFTMLEGCFVATAAFGSPLAADVGLLRRVRDRAAAGTGLAAAAADLYARSSPPVAQLIAASEAARALARGVLSPLVGVVRALDR